MSTSIKLTTAQIVTFKKQGAREGLARLKVDLRTEENRLAKTTSDHTREGLREKIAEIRAQMRQVENMIEQLGWKEPPAHLLEWDEE